MYVHMRNWAIDQKYLLQLETEVIEKLQYLYS